MSKSFKIYCVNTASYIEAEGGDTPADIAVRIADQLGFKPICVRVNNKTEDLAFPLFAPKQVEFLDRYSSSGKRVYTRSLCMMLYKAVADTMPEGTRLRIEHSISKGYYCRLLDNAANCHIELSVEDIDRLLNRMRELHRDALPFERHERLTKDVLPKFRRQNLLNKVLLLETTHELYTTYYTLDGLADSYYGALAPDTSYISVFDLKPYKQGFLLLGFDPDNHDVPQQPVTQEKMYHAFTDYLRFNQVIRVSNVGELNRVVQNRDTARLINVAEALHDKLLGRISDEISRRRREENGARVVLLAGPSSSGKTTTTKRLAIQLMTNLMTPKMISLDDYFVDRHLTPRDEKGDYDYESLYALDLDRLNSDLRRLLAGE